MKPFEDKEIYNSLVDNFFNWNNLDPSDFVWSSNVLNFKFLWVFQMILDEEMTKTKVIDLFVSKKSNRSLKDIRHQSWDFFYLKQFMVP